VLVVPDLVAEVVSSGDRTTEVAETVQMWLDAGVRLVWVLYPTRHTVEMYRSEQPMLTLPDSATLDGGDVVPGFSCPVSQVFG
jgi:Uma2 family endonuclease